MTTTALQVTVTAHQRLALGSGSEVSFLTGSHEYVPGSVLRGALAAAWIAEFGPPTLNPASGRRFRELFDSEIRYGPLYPTGSQRRPLSVFTCKYPRTPVCATAVVDEAFAKLTPCPGCKRRLARSKGQLEVPARWRTQRAIRTAIDPATGRAKDGALYAADALPAGAILSGTIHGHHPWLEGQRTIHLGGRRTVGGASDYTATTTRPAPPPPALTETLVIRLISPAIFVDTAGCPRLDPDRTLDLGNAADVERSWAREVLWSGWHVASRLPKPAEVCAEAGSTYRIRGSDTALAAVAERIVRDGIGLRRAEGFGVAEIVTVPWRPAASAEAPQTQPPPTDADSRLDRLLAMPLAPPEQRWLVGALRIVQLDLQRGGHPTVPAGQLDELLTQPAAAGLHGVHRDTIRDVLIGLDARQLHDLTILLIDSHTYRGVADDDRQAP